MKLNISTECPLWPEKPDRCVTILAIQKTFATLSIIGCLFVMTVIIVMKMYKVFFQKLILSLAFSAFCGSISYVIANVYTELNHFCRFQAFIMQYFDWSTLLWVFVITLYVLSVVLQKKNVIQNINTKYFVAMHLFVWLFALFWAVVPIFGDNYGPAGIWCWIKRDNVPLRFGAWYVPLFLICICMIMIYSYVIVKVIRNTKAEARATDEERQRNKKTRSELKPLMSYPMIFIVFCLPAFMYRIEDALHEDKPPNFALTILSAIFIPSIGACNALSFAIFNATINKLSWLKLKNSFIALFSSEPAHKIHKDIEFPDTVTADKPTVELEHLSSYGSTSKSPTTSVSHAACST